MGITKHDRIAKDIARLKGMKYNPEKGADLVNSRRAIEVEIEKSGLNKGMKQLQGYNRPRYLAVPNELVKETIKRTEGTKVGVMNEKGRIRKRAT